MNAKWGLCGVAGHSSARAIVTGRGSQLQDAKQILCSIPACGVSDQHVNPLDLLFSFNLPISSTQSM